MKTVRKLYPRERLGLETVCARTSGQPAWIEAEQRGKEQRQGGQGARDRPEALPRSSGCPEVSGCHP